jgi:glycosyltransferase involved in cell wall biosynthesis
MLRFFRRRDRLRKKPPKTLRIVQYEPSGRGGFCHYTFELAQGLTRNGCAVTLMTAGNYELEHLPHAFRRLPLVRRSRTKRFLESLFRRNTAASNRPGEPVDRPSRDWTAPLRALRGRLLFLELVFRLVRERPDVVHFQSVTSGRERILIRILKAIGCRVVFTAHNVLPHETDSGEGNDSDAAIYRLVHRVIVHSEDNRRELIQLFGLSPDRIAVIPHGSYDLFFPGGRASKETARAEIGLDRGAKVILFFGLIRRYKGLEFLLEAFERLEARFPEALLLIVGDVLRADPEGYAFYSRRIEEASRRPSVRCVPRYVPVEDVGRYLSAADLVVLPYTKTYQSGVLLAAYAAGRPVVVTQTGGLPETVQDGKTGLVVPPRDPDALARAIESLLERPDLLDEMGRNAARLADTVYSWDTVAKATVELYESLLTPEAGREPRRG